MGSDGQNDPLTYTYEWKVEGVTQQTTTNVPSTTDTFDLSTSDHGNRGEQITVTVTANDGSLTSTPTSSSTATAAVANTPPVVDSVTIDQTSPGTNQVLWAVIASSDDDGDTLTYDYQWLRDGVEISGATDATLDLGVEGDAGDEISLRVQASDGTDTSAAVTSDAATIGNAAPVVDSVTIDQSAPDTDDVVGVTVDASDGDDDTLAYDYQWTNGGVDLAGETDATLDLDVSGNGDRGDDIAVRVTASDGGATSDSVTSAAVTVANSAPVVTSVSIDQSTVHTNGTLTATVTGDDLDGDGLGIDYQWLANGSPDLGRHRPRASTCPWPATATPAT